MTPFLKTLTLLILTFIFSSTYSQDIDSLKIKMREVLGEYNIPGVSVVITSSEEILFAESVGVKNLNTTEPLTISDKIHLGSCTKALTGYLAGVSVENGVINWDSRIIDVFPELETIILEDYLNSTLNDLLSHHAGVIPFDDLSNWIELEEQGTFNGKNIKETRYNFLKWALNKEPVRLDSIESKEDYIYSNAGYIVATSMLEKANQTSWENLVEKYIFKNMKIDGIIGWPASKDTTQTWGHWMNTDSSKLVAVNPIGNWRIPDVGDPAGDVAMSPLDYVKWLQKNLKGLQGNDEEWPKEFYEYLHYANSEHSYYSIGWGSWKDSDSGFTYSNHSGSARTFYCHVLIINELDLAIAAMSNTATDKAKSGVKKLIYGYIDTLIDEEKATNK